jgi:4-hydroxysphinganine ceramide fatty acyl 2-hydroxylase
MQLAKNCTEEDAWVTFRGKVLDVSKFMHTHPGGKEYFVPLLGKDITADYEAVDHSSAALSMIDPLVVGAQDTATLPATERLIDHTKSTLWQVWSNLSLKQYNEFINSPLHVEASVRIFESDWLELLSKTPWYVVPLIWLPVAAYYLAIADLPSLELLQWWLVGLVAWSLFEYSAHRLVFHAEASIFDSLSPPTSPTQSSSVIACTSMLKVTSKQPHHSPSLPPNLTISPRPQHSPYKSALMCLHYLMHGIHHAYPMDALRLVFPPALSCIIACVIKPVYNSVLPLSLSHAIWAGKVTGYVLYDCFHYFAHHTSFSMSYLRLMKSYHMYHHYKTPHLGYGVTSKIWDVVFDTEIPMKVSKGLNK